MGHYLSDMDPNWRDREQSAMTHRVWAFLEHVKRGLEALRVSTYDKKPDDKHIQAKLRAEEAMLWARADYRYSQGFVDSHKLGDGTRKVFDGPDLTFERVLDPEDVEQIMSEISTAWHQHEKRGWGHPHPGCPMRVTVNGYSFDLESRHQFPMVRNVLMAAVCGGPSDIDLETD